MQVNDAVSAITTLENSLSGLKSALNNTINSTKNNKLKDNITSATSNINTLKKALGLGAIYAGLRKTVNVMKDIATENINMVETNNLFEVSMGKVVDQYGNLNTEASKYYTKAIDFQNEMNEKLATNKSELQEYQAMYYSMFKGQGINNDASYLMSESLTKAGYDIASLYNLSTSEAMNKIKSGIAGQVESLRTIGIDVSESSLSKVLNEVGIERSVQQLSYAEKEVARYIAIVEQAGQAQGDFAKTFESPANQIKVFKNQLIELKQVAGSFIVNAFGGIIVWANAIIMAIKEIIKSIAVLFGYDLDSGGSGNLADDIGISDLNSGLSGATKKAKELKKQLMGFDEINNISPESSTSGSGSSGVATGIDDKLLKSLKEWDNKMSSISGKAQEIRDKILEWVGLSEGIPKTFEEWWKKLGKIQKILLIIVGIVAGITVIGKITKLIKWLKTLFTILKTGKGATTTFGTGLQTIGKTIKGLKSGFTNLGSWISMVVGQYKIFKAQGNGVIDSLKLTKSALAETGQGFLSLIPTWAKVGVGIAGLVGSSVLAYNSLKDLKEGSISTTEGLLKLSGGLVGATASGALLGSTFGPVGTAVGAVTGLVIGATTSMIALNDTQSTLKEEMKKTRKNVDEQAESWRKLKEQVQETVDTQLSEQDVNGYLVDELENLVEVNGKVKSGYEARVSYILSEVNKAYGTEYQLSGNQITRNGEIVDSIKDITDNIRKQIEAKKAQIILDANEELYKNAILEKANAYNSYTEALNEQTKAQQEMNDYLAKYGLTMDDVTDKTTKFQLLSKNNWDFTGGFMELNETLENTKTLVNDSLENYKNYSTTIIQYEELSTAVIKGSSEEQAKAIEAYTNTYKKEGETRKASLKDEMNMTKIDLDNMKEIYKNNNKEINQDVEEAMNNRIRVVADKLAENTKTVEDLTDDNVDAWKTLGNQSYKVYEEELNKLEPNTRQEIQKMTGVFTEKLPEVKNVADDLGKTVIDSLDKKTEAKNVAVDEIKQFLNGLSDSQQRELLKQCGIEDADKVIQGLKQGDLSEDVGINIVKGLQTGLKNNYWQGQTLSTATSFANSILNKFKTTFDEHSPSKKTKQFGIYLLQGLGIGINKEQNNVLSTVKDFSNNLLKEFNTPLKELNQGITVNTRDMAIDTTQHVNYSAISGQIQAQSKVSLGNISDRIYNAVVNGMENAKVQVDINAKTEEGVIVKKATEGFRDYVTRTGELPFPVPV